MTVVTIKENKRTLQALSEPQRNFGRVQSAARRTDDVSALSDMRKLAEREETSVGARVRQSRQKEAACVCGGRGGSMGIAFGQRLAGGCGGGRVEESGCAETGCRVVALAMTKPVMLEVVRGKGQVGVPRVSASKTDKRDIASGSRFAFRVRHCTKIVQKRWEMFGSQFKWKHFAVNRGIQSK